MATETKSANGDLDLNGQSARAQPTLKELLLSPAPRGPLNIPPRGNLRRREVQPDEGSPDTPITFRR